jgi:competence protein ComEC
LPVLRRFGVQRLDLVVASHGDNDHVGGLHSVLDAYPDAALLATERFGLAPKQFSLCSAGTAWRWGGVRFAVLGPNQKSLHASVGDNDRSCVLGVFTNSASLLLPGDIERRGEAALIAAGLSGPFDVVIAPHHGSATSSSDGFVASVAARYVVFSTGYLNRWAFPRARVQRRWRRSGACLLDTAMTGAIVFEADEQSGLRLASMHRADARRVWHDGVAPPGCPSAAL